MSWYIHPSKQLRDDELPPELVVTNRDGSIEQVYVPYNASDQLEVENVKLREELAKWERLAAGIDLPEYPVTQFKPKDLERENAKLSELVRDMYACISHANEQDWFYFERDKLGCGMSCTFNGEACGLCALADRMRELGVEVSK